MKFDENEWEKIRKEPGLLRYRTTQNKDLKKQNNKKYSRRYNMKILYGTGNKEKIKQMNKIITVNNFDAEIMGLKDIGFDKDIIEDGETFEENSKIKAVAVREFCKKNNLNDVIIITDDTGMCVDQLDGRPGVYSARYAGDHAPQDITLNKLLNEMKEYTNMEDRGAEFVCVLTASLPNEEIIVSRGEIKGKVAINAGKLGGLTYEPVFIPDGFDKPMSEMSMEEFAKVKNHRDIAMINIFKKLQEMGY